MSRTSRVLRGAAVGYVNQALTIVVGLWFTAFLLVRLGQTDYGLWLVGTRILGYLLLLDLGIVALLPREIGMASGAAGGDQSTSEIAELVARTRRLVSWQMPVVLLVAAAVWIGLPTEWAPLRYPLLIVLAAFVVAFPLRTLQAALNGLQDLAFLATVFTITWLVSTAATVALILAGLGLYALAVGWVVSQALSALLWWQRLRRRHPDLLRHHLPSLPPGALKDRITRSLLVSVQKVAHIFLYGTDVLIIGKLLGPDAVVPYFCTAKVLTVLGHQPQLLAQTAEPAIAELRSGAPPEQTARVLGALTTAILILSGAIVCVVLVVNEGFVAWWVGAKEFGGAALTMILLAGMLLRHWNVTAAYSLFAFARDHRLTATVLVDGIVTVTASIVLVHRYGIIGAAIGSVIGVCLVALPANLVGLARELGTGVPSLVRPLWGWFWRFALIAAACLLASRVWITDTLPALILGTLAAGGLYGGLMLPLLFREPLATYVRPRLDALRRLTLRRAAMGDVDA